MENKGEILVWDTLKAYWASMKMTVQYGLDQGDIAYERKQQRKREGMGFLSRTRAGFNDFRSFINTFVWGKSR